MAYKQFSLNSAELV